MATQLTYSGATVPTAGEGPDWPASLLTFGNGIDQLLNLKATSQSNRDTLYANVSASTLVPCASVATLWMKTTTPPTAAAWVKLAEVGTVATSGILTAQSGWTISVQRAQKRNGTQWIRGTITNSGSDLVIGSTGNVGHTPIATIASSYLPDTAMLGTSSFPFYWNTYVTNGGGSIDPVSGVMNITCGNSSSTISAGHNVIFLISFPGV